MLHMPVLLAEVLEHLAIKTDGIYIDGTFGRGGHSKAILQRLGPNGRLFAIDKDHQAIAAAKQAAALQDQRFTILQGDFGQLTTLLAPYKLSGQVNGILLDLGVSSPQLDDAERGFSFLRSGPLDMRMDTSRGLDAASWLAQVKEEELASVLKNYGEERFAKRIANAIVNAREHQPITTTGQLAEIIANAHPAWEKHKHPATRSFQGIRIFLNNELEALTAALTQSLDLLTKGGRLLIITFHSLEDQIVKRFIREHAQAAHIPKGLPIPHAELPIRLKKVNGAIRPQSEEISANPRARSATLRIMEKLL